MILQKLRMEPRPLNSPLSFALKQMYSKKRVVFMTLRPTMGGIEDDWVFLNPLQ
jgi:hypothetical protein